MAVATLKRIVRLEESQLVLRQLQPLGLELFRRIDCSEDLSPHFLRGLHLASDFFGLVVLHMAVGANGAYARTVRVVDCALELGKHVVPHLMATRAEFLRICQLHGGIERAPEENTANETADGQKSQTEMNAGAPDHCPVALEKCQHK